MTIIWKLTFNVLDQLGVVFDPDKHCFPIPMEKRQDKPKRQIQSKRQPDNVIYHPDGKYYLREDDIENLSTSWDSKKVNQAYGRDGSQFDNYDEHVLAKYELDEADYRLMKKYWADKISYRKAGEIHTVRNRKGCGQRKRADYWKAYNEAHNMRCTPLPR